MFKSPFDARSRNTAPFLNLALTEDSEQGTRPVYPAQDYRTSSGRSTGVKYKSSKLVDQIEEREESWVVRDEGSPEKSVSQYFKCPLRSLFLQAVHFLPPKPPFASQKHIQHSGSPGARCQGRCRERGGRLATSTPQLYLCSSGSPCYTRAMVPS